MLNRQAGVGEVQVDMAFLLFCVVEVIHGEVSIWTLSGETKDAVVPGLAEGEQTGGLSRTGTHDLEVAPHVLDLRCIDGVTDHGGASDQGGHCVPGAPHAFSLGSATE